MAPYAATARPAAAPRTLPSLRLDWPRIAVWAVAFGGCIAFWVGVALAVAALL
ncbi:hypothetical protein [Miltoncostaea oceani]|uniref:hypothetical protein n=1 Tax=Miltoncostaea oceani TaxID=2843216 RepID=UPI001C3C3F9A|nr:hypothetical protein [Miltoncostaea oceani]